MINLVPQTAKKKLLIEYWARVSSVWLLLWGVAMVAGAMLLFPTYVLITTQIDAFASSAKVAAQKVASHESVTQELILSSQLAKFIIDQRSVPQLSEYLALIEQHVDESIEVTRLTFNRSEGGLAPAQVTGVAADRESLAAFKDRLKADERIVEPKLPIENLAKDRDIPFSIEVVFTKESV
jgi:hypothetical protein